MSRSKFKPLSGNEDQAGGVVWRWKDGDNYYVARANALENNVSLYYTSTGGRITIKYVDAPVAKNTVAHAARRVRGHAHHAWRSTARPTSRSTTSTSRGAGARRRMDEGRQRHVVRRLRYGQDDRK